MRAISQEIPQPSVTKINMKITYLKVHQNLPGANDLNNNFMVGHVRLKGICLPQQALGRKIRKHGLFVE